MKQDNTKFIGMDVHKNTISIAIADGGRKGELRSYGTIPNDIKSIDKFIRKQISMGNKLHVVYEAGPTGYGIYRHLVGNGIECIVVAPSMIPKKSGVRIKNDRRDALTVERMKTADEEFVARTMDFIDRAHKADKPFFAWLNPTRMHVWTHLKDERKGVTGQGIYADGLVEHDDHVGQILKQLDDLGIADNTIVVWTTDNGAEVFSWPDGGTIPFAGEKNTNWEGGYRVPMMVRWPAKIKAGVISNEIVSMEDWVSTLMAAVGEPDVKEKLLKGHEANGKTFKVHLDSYNLLPLLTGEEEKSPREEFLYWNDAGQLVGLRYQDWKMVYMEQRAHGWDVWTEPMITLRFPKVMNLRRDPYERALHESNFYHGWWVNRFFLMVPTQAFVREWIASFEEFPVRQKPASFNLEQVLESMERAASRN